MGILTQFDEIKNTNMTPINDLFISHRENENKIK